MLQNITPERAIKYIKIAIAFSLCWPLKNTANKVQILCLKISRFLGYLNMWMIIVPLFMTLQDWNTDLEACLKAIPVLLGGTQLVIQMILYHQKGLQLLIIDMEDQCKQVQGYEKDVLQRYLNKCALFFVLSLSWFYGGAFLFNITPLISPEPLPLSAKYPFEEKDEPIRSIIYIQQFIAGIQIAAQLCANQFATALLWFTVVKFEVLSNDLRMIASVEDLIRCTKRHHEILRYSNEVIDAVRALALVTTAFSVMAILFCALTFISHQPIVIKFKFMSVAIMVLWEMLAWCWSADNLLDVSSNVGQAAYDSEWYFQNVSLQKNLIPIIIRCQKPVIVSVPCVIPVLSLNYLGSFISAVFSYFATIRMVMEDE